MGNFRSNGWNFKTPTKSQVKIIESSLLCFDVEGGWIGGSTYRWKFVPTEQPVVSRLLGAHLAGDGETVVLAVLVVTLDIEVSEVDGDPER